MLVIMSPLMVGTTTFCSMLEASGRMWPAITLAWIMNDPFSIEIDTTSKCSTYPYIFYSLEIITRIK